MKVVCVGDTYITDQMMRDGVSPLLGKDDSIEVFFFGDPDKTKMRDIAKDIEAGKREEIAVPEGLLEAVADAELLIVHLCPVNKNLIEGESRCYNSHRAWYYYLKQPCTQCQCRCRVYNRTYPL